MSSLDELRAEVTFWREQYHLAADVAKVLADVNDHDGRVAELERLLRQEIERREKAERELLAGQRSDERKGQVSASLSTQAAEPASAQGVDTPGPETGSEPVCDCGHDGLPPIFHFDCPVKRADNARRREAAEQAREDT